MSSASIRSTPLQHSSTRRLSRVFVEIPPSPFTDVRKSLPHGSQHTTFCSANLKENSRPHPFKIPPHADATISIPCTLKRKLPMPDFLVASPKKPKLLSAPDTDASTRVPGISNNATIATTANSTGNVLIDFPNGHFYCHHCNSKLDLSVGIRCTARKENRAKGGVILGRRCTIKFCRRCLKIRYGEDVELIKAKGRTPSKKDKPHVEEEPYTFKCPKCRDICFCSKCRKAKGLPPLRNRAVPGHTSTAPKISGDPFTTGTSLDKYFQSAPDNHPAVPNLDKGPSLNPDAHNATTKTLVKSNPPVKAKLKPMALHKPTWTAVRTILNHSQAQDRFLIREFASRFSALGESLARSHLEELSEIAGRGGGTAEDGDAEEGWVSKTCVKAVVVWLLGVIASDVDRHVQKSIETAVKQIRWNGANLNKMWSILASLRDTRTDSSTTDSLTITFPDPSPPSTWAIMHNTRATRRQITNNATGYITNSAQMVPVLAALTEVALRTSNVREGLETAVKSGKELVKEVREECRREDERWDLERVALEAEMPKKSKGNSQKIKAKREAHKQIIRHLENALKVVMFAYAPRFGPLGRDSEGRTYWALSPGSTDTDSALELIISGKENALGNRRAKRGKKKRDLEERKTMKDWSWFVGVWGKRPPLPETANGERQKGDETDDSDDEDERNEDEERWWGFWEPNEIKNVAGWIWDKARLYEGEDQKSDSTPSPELPDEDDENSGVLGPPTRSELCGLVHSLEQYAELLEWRIKREGNTDSTHEDNIDQGQGKGKGFVRKSAGTISGEQFYARRH